MTQFSGSNTDNYFFIYPQPILRTEY
ncbi:BnaA07g09390D [Brassica napus]|uniref:BnaA07g09390D protein n=1 Tax=Brassica napus TaxID=3708 RepID=A0A078HRD0_BRANA|nr:BnaA07g09390D [Brassica napus]